MVRVLLLGYTTGVRSSRKLEAACWEQVAFRWLAGGEAPAYRAIAKFRKRHLSALGHLFVQALELCQAAGMVSLGKVALDGTKVRANASRRKAMSYARMTDKQKILAAEVSELLAEAERIDKDEDAKFGKDSSGNGLPDELARREGRLRPVRAMRGDGTPDLGHPAGRAPAPGPHRQHGDGTTGGQAAHRGAAEAHPVHVGHDLDLGRRTDRSRRPAENGQGEGRRGQQESSHRPGVDAAEPGPFTRSGLQRACRACGDGSAAAAARRRVAADDRGLAPDREQRAGLVEDADRQLGDVGDHRLDRDVQQHPPTGRPPRYGHSGWCCPG